MTTTSAQPDRTMTVLRSGVLWVLAVAVLLTLLAALAAGRTEALSALAGAGAVLVVFVAGMAVVGVVTRIMPGASLLIALLTYVLQLLVLAIVGVGVLGSPAGEDIVRGWLAAGVITATFAWMAGILLATVRLPLTPLPGPGVSPAVHGTEASVW